MDPRILLAAASLPFMCVIGSMGPQDVATVHNPAEPPRGEIVMRLEKDLTIGDDSGGAESFARGVTVIVNPGGGFYVLDTGECRILKYDDAGRLLLAFGRKGRGPDEFPALLGATVGSDGLLYVNKDRAIAAFDGGGKLVKSLSTGVFVFAFAVSADGNILATTNAVSAESGMSYDLAALDSSGRLVATIARFPNRMIAIVDGAAVGLRNGSAPSLHFAPLDGGRAVYGFSAKYELAIADASGRVLVIFDKAGEPRRLTAKDRERILDDEMDALKRQRTPLARAVVERNYPFAAEWPRFQGLMADERGRIYVVRLEDRSGRPGAVLDVFDAAGKYLWRARTDPPLPVAALTSRHVFTVRSDPDSGYFFVDRYRIANSDQMR